MKLACVLAVFATAAAAQGPSMKDLMLDLIHPAFNDLLLLVSRGGPKDEKEWAAARRSALTVEESARLLSGPGLSRNGDEWLRATKLFTDAATAAYLAAKAKDAKALGAAAESMDASCTACHKQYRPNVFPPGGASN